jgi:hypothetical protein
MTNSSRPAREGLFKSIAAAYAILLLHVLLIACLGLLVIFFSGIIRYMTWIVLGGVLLLIVSAFLFYRRMKREGRTLSELLRKPQFQGRSVEIEVLGGLMTLRLGRPGSQPLIGSDEGGPVAQLEDPETVLIREIAALGRLLEKELITPEEFARAKRRLLER